MMHFLEYIPIIKRHMTVLESVIQTAMQKANSYPVKGHCGVVHMKQSLLVIRTLSPYNISTVIYVNEFRDKLLS